MRSSALVLPLIVLASIFFEMGIKSEKTFEEIVERLVALFKGQHEDGVAEAEAPRSPQRPDSASSVPLQAPSEDDVATS